MRNGLGSRRIPRPFNRLTNSLTHRLSRTHGLSAEPIERVGQVRRDRVSGAAFDLPALEHEHDLAILQQADRRRAGRIAREVGACLRGRLDVLAGEDRRRVVGLHGVAQRRSHRGACVASGAAAHGVHHHQRCAGRILEPGVHLVGGAKLFDAEPSELLPHRSDETLIVHHLLTSLMDSVRLLAHQREDGLLWDDEIPLALEGDLAGRFAKEQRVVAAPGLHGNEARFARRLLPRLLARMGIESRHRLTGTDRDDGASLHRLAVERRGWQVQPDLRALFPVLDFHEHAVADDDQFLVVADHDPVKVISHRNISASAPKVPAVRHLAYGVAPLSTGSASTSGAIPLRRTKMITPASKAAQIQIDSWLWSSARNAMLGQSWNSARTVPSGSRRMAMRTRLVAISPTVSRRANSGARHNQERIVQLARYAVAMPSRMTVPTTNAAP